MSGKGVKALQWGPLLNSRSRFRPKCREADIKRGPNKILRAAANRPFPIHFLRPFLAPFVRDLHRKSRWPSPGLIDSCNEKNA